MLRSTTDHTGYSFEIAGRVMPGMAYGSGAQRELQMDRELARLAQSGEITVLVTDSGLGGLSVCAAADALARSTGRFRRMRLIFANALPESGSGYNRMGSLDEKVRVFDAAIRGMVDAYVPDLVLIACNTLSVVYPLTSHAGDARIPVVGIVRMGVEMIAEELLGDPGSVAIIFGTETTIAAGMHKRLLEERGVVPGRLIFQACSGLAGLIERDAGGAAVQEAVGRCVDEAAGKMAAPATTYVAALCCTHYGYAAPVFKAEMQKRTGGAVTVVDPNKRMGRLLFPDSRPPVHSSPAVSVHVVSRAVIAPEEVRSIGTLLAPVSPATAAALQEYELNRDLFPYSNT